MPKPKNPAVSSEEGLVLKIIEQDALGKKIKELTEQREAITKEIKAMLPDYGATDAKGNIVFEKDHGDLLVNATNTLSVSSVIVTEAETLLKRSGYPQYVEMQPVVKIDELKEDIEAGVFSDKKLIDRLFTTKESFSLRTKVTKKKR